MTTITKRSHLPTAAYPAALPPPPTAAPPGASRGCPWPTRFLLTLLLGALVIGLPALPARAGAGSGGGVVIDIYNPPVVLPPFEFPPTPVGGMQCALLASPQPVDAATQAEINACVAAITASPPYIGVCGNISDFTGGEPITTPGVLVGVCFTPTAPGVRWAVGFGGRTDTYSPGVIGGVPVTVHTIQNFLAVLVGTGIACAPPQISGVSATPSVLWPPDFTMVPVTVNYTASSACGPTVCTLSVSSNEPDDALGAGNASPDWQVLDAHHVLLRAERSGLGSGRIYTITITCTDNGGHSSSQTVTVTVPLNQGSG